MFNLRNAFVQTLQAKAVQQNARENLAYWDRELTVQRNRLRRATWRRWTSTAWSCSGYNSSPIWRWRW